MEERDFFRDPFSRVEIEALLGEGPASEMFSFQSPAFRKLGVDRDKLTDDELIDLMLKEPRLIRRPVVRIGQRVHFGADARVLDRVVQ